MGKRAKVFVVAEAPALARPFPPVPVTPFAGGVDISFLDVVNLGQIGEDSVGCRALFLSSAIVFGLCPPCRADLLYTVAFDQVSFESFTYPGDSFSFTTTSIVPGGFLGMVGQIIPVPDGEINGFMFTEVIHESQTSTSSLFISRPFALSGVRGKIDEIFFQITTSMNGPGVYPLPIPGDGYCIDAAPVAACLGINVPSGSLTIAQAVPEPGVLPLVAGATGLIGWISWLNISRQLWNSRAPLGDAIRGRPIENVNI